MGRVTTVGTPSVAAAADVTADVCRLSRGGVLAVTAGGPVLAHRRGYRFQLGKDTFVPALGGPDRVMVALLTAGWLVCLAGFWTWWLQPAHLATYVGLIINGVILLYVSVFPVFFVAGANRLRRVNPARPVPPLRVAFVVTKAPSEPWQIARRTLRAMLAQDYPLRYDVWLCDEQPTPAVADWCARNGVRLSSRHGVGDYHRPAWPRRTRCKEGNLAYFYDRWGYQNYQAVAQLDCDHVPAPSYLAEMIRAFSDPAIGYVAAPSVCDANAPGSWAARGRVYREATFHGPFQLGHSDGYGPLCIGSHYAVRTTALRDIGGIGPDLAEDFSTTFLLNAAGWHGAFAIDAEAHGAGPITFAAMSLQEYQWARSLTTILLGLVPRNIGRLEARMRVRFLYALSYYPLLSVTTLLGLALAPAAAITGQPWIRVNYLAFLAHSWSVAIWLVLLTVLLRGRDLLRPPAAPVFSWESWLYSLTRWPYVAQGIAAGIAAWLRPRLRLRPRPVTFAVTPKVARSLEPLRIRQVVPFFVISMVASGAALAGERFGGAAGYVFLSVAEGVTYAIVAAAVPLLHAAETAANAGVARGVAVREAARGPLLLAALAGVVAVAALALYPGYLLSVVGR
jgi:cellulose synthase (UDP-forming)